MQSVLASMCRMSSVVGSCFIYYTVACSNMQWVKRLLYTIYEE